jgi:hypothetical protein
MKDVEITRTSADELEQETWKFYFDDRAAYLRLSSYSKSTRASKRHGFKPVAGDDSFAQARNRGYRRMTRDEAPLPEDVAAEALATFISRLTVGR